MGLGGHLMWTAVFREIKLRNPEAKILFTRPRTFKDMLKGRKFGQPVISPVFENNPHLDLPEDVSRKDRVIQINPNNPRYQYYYETTPERQLFKTGGHAIEIICREFGIENPKLKCELYFNASEIEKVEKIAGELGPFIAIEPHTKDEFTVNKRWELDKWQQVVDQLAAGHRIVQVGQEGGCVLAGVTSLVGELTFRETAALIGKSKLLIAPEGGLMHAANAVDTKAVIVYTGYISPKVTGYPDHINLYPVVECGNCGLRKPCPIGLVCSGLITPEMVISAADQALDNSGGDVA